MPFLIFHYCAVFDRMTGASATTSRCVYGCGGVILWSDREPSFQPWMLKFLNWTEIQHSFQITKQNRDKALWENTPTPLLTPGHVIPSCFCSFYLFDLFSLIAADQKAGKKSPWKQSESGSENGMSCVVFHHKEKKEDTKNDTLLA